METHAMNEKGSVMSAGNCDCCERTEVELAGAAASALGPITLMYCVECRNAEAEPLWMMQAMYDDLGSALTDEFFEIKVYSNGAYMTFREHLRQNGVEVGKADGKETS